MKFSFTYKHTHTYLECISMPGQHLLLAKGVAVAVDSHSIHPLGIATSVLSEKSYCEPIHTFIFATYMQVRWEIIIEHIQKQNANQNNF